MTAITALLPSRALVRLAGPDWRSFLQGLVTRDLEETRADPVVFAALLAPQGRLLHDFFIWNLEPDEAVLDVDASAASQLTQTLQRYRLRAKVMIEARAGVVEIAFDGAPEGTGWRKDPRLSELGWRRLDLTSKTSSDPDPLKETAYETLRLRLGVTETVRDARPNDYPLELNLDLLNGVDFKKGCFVGQETTSRMHRRGGVRSRLAPVTFDGPPPSFGADVFCGALRVGEIRSGAEGGALAMVRLDRVFLGPLEAEGRPVAVDPQPWLLERFKPPASAESLATP